MLRKTKTNVNTSLKLQKQTCLSLKGGRYQFHPRSQCRPLGSGQLNHVTASGRCLQQHTHVFIPTEQLARAMHTHHAGLTGGGVSHTQGHEVGDGGLALGEGWEATRGELLGLLSGWQLVEGQVVLLFKQLPGSRSEAWDTSSRTDMMGSYLHMHSLHIIHIHEKGLF